MIIELLKPITEKVLVVMTFFSIFTIITQSNLAYATSAEKIPLVQQFEQFPGQEVTGFCRIQVDDEGYLHWSIKVNGLEPKTQGHFDLGHWAGEFDVPYTADDDGKADSGYHLVEEKNLSYRLFSQFAKCQVHTSGFNHFTSPVIANAIPGSSNADADENKKQNPSENKFFLFYSLDYVFGIFKSNNANADEDNNQILSEKKSSNAPENKGVFAIFDSFFGPPAPPSYNPPQSKTTTFSIDVNKVDEKQSIIITSPTKNSVVTENIKIQAVVKNSPNAAVIFYVDGFPIGTDFKAPYEMLHNTSEMSAGKHPIKVEISSTEINHTITVIKQGKAIDKASDNNVSQDSGTADKGDSEKANGNNGSQNAGSADKGNSDKASEKASGKANDNSSRNNSSEEKDDANKGSKAKGTDSKCNPGQQKKGLC